MLGPIYFGHLHTISIEHCIHVRKYCRNAVEAPPKPKTQPLNWREPVNRQKWIDEFSKQHNITSLDDWYKITSVDIRQAPNGLSMLTQFRYSPLKMLQSLFPHHEWSPTKFQKTPQHFWSDAKEQRKILDSVAEQLGVKTAEDWYQVSREQVFEHGAGSVLQKHKNSLWLTLNAVYPEHCFQGWRFKTVPRGFWTMAEHRREYMEHCHKVLKLENFQGWYSVSKAQIVDLGGSGLLARYKDKVGLLVMDSFPEHDWEPWRFSRTIAGFWKEPKNRARYFDWLAKRLQLESNADWYRVSVAEIRSHDGAGILQRYSDSLYQALKDAYPNHDWETWKFKNDHVTIP